MMLCRKSILILASNPKGTSKLRLDEEIREIDQGLQRSQRREQFLLEQKWAVRPRDIYRAILDFRPQILHFCGHGAGNDGLVLEDENGKPQLISAEAIANLLELFSPLVECVFLNACYSEIQAQAINQHIDYVIGMTQGIGDQAAINFAVGFYDALGAGQSYEFAFKLACSAIEISGIQEQSTPVIKKKKMTMKDEQWLALIARICRNRNFQSEERRRDIHRFLLECQEVDVVIQTQNISFESTQNLWQKLPWHWWDFFAQDHFTDVALSFSNSESVISDEEEPRLSQPKRVKILCVLGKPGNEQDKNKIDGVVLSIFLSLILIERETGLIDTIVTSREKAARYSIFGLIGGSIYVLIRLHFTDRYDLSNLEHIFDIFIELLIFTTLPGLIGLLDKGENLAQTIIPNQGVWKSAQNAGLFFSIFFL
jgi:hypothetical protein